MGSLLTVVAVLGLVLFALLAAGGAATIFFADRIKPALPTLTASLPAGITPETSVLELLELDRSSFQTNFIPIVIHGLLSIVFYGVVAALFLRIGLAWRRLDPFGCRMIGGLRWLGILFLMQTIFGFVYVNFLYNNQLAPFSAILTYNTLGQRALEGLTGTYGTTLSCGILFLTMSWVLEHGKKLKDELDLTV